MQIESEKILSKPRFKPGSLGQTMNPLANSVTLSLRTQGLIHIRLQAKNGQKKKRFLFHRDLNCIALNQKTYSPLNYSARLHAFFELM
jgi:hypothetical protein